MNALSVGVGRRTELGYFIKLKWYDCRLPKAFIQMEYIMYDDKHFIFLTKNEKKMRYFRS